MKAKYLIAMLALPTVFAACSQDELVNVDDQQKTITGKLYGENLTFGIEKGTEANTRLTTAGAWEANDTIGMAWVSDQYNDGGVMKPAGGAICAFTGATKVLGNTPLYFVNGTNFRSGTNMFVGTYIAYYPFDNKVKSVDVLKLGVGADQETSTLEDAYGKMVFTSDTLSLQDENAGTGKTPAVTLKRLSNLIALEIALKADNANYPNVTISKVELDIQDNGSNSLLAVDGTVVPKNWTAANTVEADKKYMKALNGTTDYLTPGTGSALSVTANEPLAVSKNTAATVYVAFMPSDLTTSPADDNNCVLNIYTNYGVVKLSTANAIKLYTYDAVNKKYNTTPADIDNVFNPYSRLAGQLIKQKAVIDITKVSVDGLTATNSSEIRDIVTNWKKQGNNATAITINVAHASYEQSVANEKKASAQNIVLDGLDLSDIPNNLTLVSPDTLVFTGTTNLNAAKTITVNTVAPAAVTGAEAALIFNGETTIGTLNANSGMQFNATSTIAGTLTQIPTDANDKIMVKNGVTLTVDGGKLLSNTDGFSKLINKGTISLINSGSINGGELNKYLAIDNFAVKTNTPTVTYYNGTINIGNADSKGYLDGVTAANFDNTEGTVRYFNGEYVAPGEGKVVAVANNALSFAAAVDNNVTTIEVTGEIKFAAFDLTTTAGKATNVIMKSGSKLNMGTKEVTLGSVTVAENATISGKKLIVFKTPNTGALSVSGGATLTVDTNTVINANVLNLPTGSKIEGDGETSKVVYKTAGSVGGTYTADVAQKSNLAGVE